MAEPKADGAATTTADAASTPTPATTTATATATATAATTSAPPAYTTIDVTTLAGKSPDALSVDEKLALITARLQETIGVERVRPILAERALRVYWGTAPTGRPHAGYLVPLSKLADFLAAGCEVTVLLADLHAQLDAGKSAEAVVGHRTAYYKAVITATLEAIGVPIDKLRFVQGTEYQLSEAYTRDVYRVVQLVSENDARRAGAEVVKQSSNPLLSGLIYPLLQALDEEYLKCDAQFGGIDQRKIFMLADFVLPRLGYAKRAHLCNAMVPGLTGDKMSSSVADSKIDLIDSPVAIKEKLARAFCEPGNVERNGVLSFAKMVLFPLIAKRGRRFSIRRDAKYGGDVEYASFDELERDFAAERLFPTDLKAGVCAALVELLAPVREKFAASPELTRIAELAYPAPGGAGAGGKGKKGAKKGGGAAAAGPAVNAWNDAEPDLSRLDVRVGRIVDARVHPDADGLIIENVDVGDAEPRQVVSGMRRWFPDPAAMVGRRVVVLCNVKPGNMRGVKSHAMLLAATDGEHLELLEPPAACVAGDRAHFNGFAAEQCGEPEPVLNPKKKMWETIAPELRTTSDGLVMHRSEFTQLTTKHGDVTVASLKNVVVK